MLLKILNEECSKYAHKGFLHSFLLPSPKFTSSYTNASEFLDNIANAIIVPSSATILALTAAGISVGLASISICIGALFPLIGFGLGIRCAKLSEQEAKTPLFIAKSVGLGLLISFAAAIATAALSIIGALICVSLLCMGLGSIGVYGSEAIVRSTITMGKNTVSFFSSKHKTQKQDDSSEELEMQTLNSNK